jgi:hypothetical protein
MKNVRKRILNEIWYLVEVELSNTVNKNVETESIYYVREKLRFFTDPQIMNELKKKFKL